MPNSLTKTTVALLLAAIAVLVTAGIAMRDFIRDVNPTCPGTLTPRLDSAARIGPKDPRVALQVVEAKLKDLTPPQDAQFRLVYELAPQNTPMGYPTGYKNVRLEWLGASADAPCVCGSIPLLLDRGNGPYGVALTFEPRSNRYLVGSVDDEPTAFTIEPTPSHHLQTARILSRRHLSLAVSFAAFLALGVAWLRQRKARAYALAMHAWREAELTSGQMIQSETGEMLGALQSSSRRIWQRAGKILVAPEALGGSGLYRDVPAIEPRHVARGGHDAWARATMIRLRDARALAILSTLTSLLAITAHLVA